MPKNLETISHEEITSRIKKGVIKNPEFEDLLKDQETYDIFNEYLEDLIKNHPKINRAMNFAQMYDQLSKKERPKFIQKIEDQMHQAGELNKEYIEKYLHPKENRAKGTLRMLTKEIPFIGATTGYALLEHKYRKEIAKGFAKRASESFNNPWGQYLNPFLGKKEMAKDIAKIGAKEGTLSLWGVINGPLAYSLGAYAIYRTIKYLIKRKKEKKINLTKLKSLEKMREEMAKKSNLLEQHLRLAS